MSSRALAALVLTLAVSHAPVGVAPAAASPTTKAHRKASQKKGYAAFEHKRASAKARTAARGKPLLAVSQASLGAYVDVMKADTIELIFKPASGDTGHTLVRVADKLFSIPSVRGLERGHVDYFSKSHASSYGFVFRVGKARVGQLLKAYRTLGASDPDFGMSASGANNCYSCAALVTSVLAEHAPDLGVRSTIGAISAGWAALRNPRVDAITLYGPAIAEADGDTFSFEKIGD